MIGYLQERLTEASSEPDLVSSGSEMNFYQQYLTDDLPQVVGYPDEQVSKVLKVKL